MVGQINWASLYVRSKTRAVEIRQADIYILVVRS